MNSGSFNILGLSEEILLQILSNLSDHQEDIVNVSHTCSKLNRLVKDKFLCENLVLTWNIHVERLSLVKFVHDRLNLIAKLNFNDLYWLPSGIIRNIVVKLPHLKVFYAAGTKLSWVHLQQFLNCTSEGFTHLGWTLDNIFAESGSGQKYLGCRDEVIKEIRKIQVNLARLRVLVLHVPGLTKSLGNSNTAIHSTALSCLISACKGLEELWIFSWRDIISERVFTSSIPCEQSNSDIVDLPNLHTFVLKVQGQYDISVPTLVYKIITNLTKAKVIKTAAMIMIEKRPHPPIKQFWFDHGLAFLHFYNGIEGQELDLSSVTSFSFPIANEVNFPVYQNYNLVKCKNLQLTHAYTSKRSTVDLTYLFDSAVNLEKFSSTASTYTLDWEHFVNTHPKLEEINISQDGSLVYPGYCIALSTLQNLKKLSIPEGALTEISDSVILEQYEKLNSGENTSPKANLQDQESNGASNSTGTKGTRIAHRCYPVSRRICGFNFITSFCPEINELEVGFSNLSVYNVLYYRKFVTESLASIRNFPKLKKLTLNKIRIISGAFLIEIARCCPLLESLRLSHLGLLGKCIYIQELCRALRIMTELKDFRLEQKYIGSSDQLFSALSSCRKLERLVILCLKNDKPLTVQKLEGLMESCERLSVLFIVIEKTPKNSCRAIRLRLEALYKSIRSPLSIVVQNNLDEKEVLNYPSVHSRQLVLCAPQVCAQMEFPNISRS